MSTSSLEVDKMLDVYIYDYLLKRKLHASAQSFQTEGEVPVDPTAIDVPGGFLLEWWSVFWDIFITKTNKHHSGAAASYLELQKQKYLPKTQHIQQLMPQRHIQHYELQQQLKQPRDRSKLVKDSANSLVDNFFERHNNLATANKMVAEMYEKMLVKDVSQFPDSNLVSACRAAMDAQPPSQMLHDSLGNSSENFDTQNRRQQLPGSQNLNGGMKSILNSRGVSSRADESLVDITGSDQDNGDLSLKGWSLTGWDQLMYGQPESLIQLPQAFNQYQLQHQFMLQPPQDLGILSANMTPLRTGVPLNYQNTDTGKDNQLTTNVSDVESLIPVCCPVLRPVDEDMLVEYGPEFKNISPKKFIVESIYQPQKKQLKIDDQKPQQLKIDEQKQQRFLQHLVSNQPSQNSSHHIQQEVKLPCARIENTNDSRSNNFEANDQADVDHFMDDGTVDDVQSFISPKESELTDRVGPALKEIRLIPASTSKVECCRFSCDGKLLASCGHDRKATVWCTESFTLKFTLDEHAQWVTDVGFSANTLKIATSSGDRTVKVWDVGNPGHSLRTFMGHSTGVTSLDFHPRKDDLICSCDINSEIRYWSIKSGSCVGIFKGGATQLRFQPNNGRILAAAVGNVLSVIDVETQVSRLKLQGHKNNIHSVCWDPSGEYLASVSDDVAKVWKVGSGGKGDCIHELNCMENKFRTCAFHPTYPFLLIIGSYESLELWNMTENKTRTLQAHDKLISSLAVSNVTGLVASASHDKCVKLWH